MKGKALRRALATNDVVRINANLPSIRDTTELISPQDAERMLENNLGNRPVNWKKVEEYAELMRAAQWQLHPQGIILDPEGNILTGQTRLWAVVYSGVSVYFRVSRGSPPETAFVIDRGRPQSARDLSTRRTERRHSPVEASIARAMCILRGNINPSPDLVADIMTDFSETLSSLIRETKGKPKTKAMLMILAAIADKDESVAAMVRDLDPLADSLERALLPYTASGCWGRGASFGMAMKKAAEIVEHALTGKGR